MNTLRYVIEYINATNHVITPALFNEFLTAHQLAGKQPYFFSKMYRHEYMQSFHSAYILQELKNMGSIDKNWMYTYIPVESSNTVKHIADGMYINNYSRHYITMQYKFLSNTQSSNQLNTFINNYIVLNMLFEIGFFDTNIYSLQQKYLSTDSFDSVNKNYLTFRDYKSVNYDPKIVNNLIETHNNYEYKTDKMIAINEYKSKILRSKSNFISNEFEKDSELIINKFRGKAK